MAFSPRLISSYARDECLRPAPCNGRVQQRDFGERLKAFSSVVSVVLFRCPKMEDLMCERVLFRIKRDVLLTSLHSVVMMCGHCCRGDSSSESPSAKTNQAVEKVL
ncbi:unnamed protein product [Protopolystoma xenopodis]|uniref:Uncharacterized protein n=1 Tax=Protopolystoma xenopodis TaxID=117903 RepID=A0A448XFM5_9PLAT|nr:unnamed protein product [Protopolystoma xenopodis]